MKKRVLSLMCAAVMTLGCVAEPVLAAETESAQETTMENSTETVSETFLENNSELLAISEETIAAENDLMLLEETHKEEPDVEAIALGGGKFELKLTGIETPSDFKTLYVPVWQSADQSDIVWYKAEKQEDGNFLVRGNIENHQYHMGTYKVHVYIETQNGNMNHILSSNLTIPGMSVGAFYDVENEYSRTLVLENVESQGTASKVYFAVWGNESGQNDIYWYEATANGSTYSAEVMLFNHNELGSYSAHAYISGKDGSMKHVTSLTFHVDELPDEKIEVVNVNGNKGQASVKFYLNRKPEAISVVYLAAWSKKDQSDMYWYEAEKQSDGSYLATMDVNKHNGNLGTYSLHGYVRDNNGNMLMVDTTSYAFNLSAGEFSAAVSDTGYSERLTVNDVLTQGIEEKVYFAVWSAANGQDDMYWYEASANGNTYSTDVMFYNHKNAGTYQAHIYLAGKDGKMHLLKKATFEVESIPEEKVELISVDNTKGKFDVKLYVNKPESAIGTIYLAAWSKADQSDIYWYKATKQSDGSYLVKGDVSNHQYNTGTYKLHGYVQDKQGNMIYISSTSCILEFISGSLSINETDNEYMKQLVLENTQTQGIVNKVYFAVWSNVDGQDDMYWYEAVAKGGNYVSDILLHNHKNTGTYNVHTYMLKKNGQMQLIKTMTFDFNAVEMPKDSVVVSNVDEEKGLFDVNICLTRAQAEIDIIYVPVWTRSDQSDIVWYEAERQNNGGYKVKVDAINHQWNSGNYNVHVYVKSPEGNMNFLTSTSVYMELGRRVAVETIDTRSVRIKVYGWGEGVTNVSFPVWTVENGQDDLLWYEGQKNADGSWSVDVHTKNHNNAGAFICDVYVEEYGESYCVERVEFSIAEKWENTWRWIDGYKRYINSNGEIDTDVSRLVTGPYLIKVYKWSNYLIVFAQDENGEYNVPVKAMVTSCGNATPVGTFYTPYRWRWLTMLGGSQAQWVTQITGDFLFHSVPYRVANPTTLYVDNMFNHLGTTRSAGCIRLQAGNAKWIYDNCALGTKVIITTSESGGPLAKPGFTPVPSWHTWDPTDPTVQHLCAQHGCH